ncbi:MAG: alpha/beta fold hydrolase [Cytophagaceae bacterium]
MKHIYFVSGLGADERVFDFLTLDESVQKHFIQWLKPETGENIESYAQRLCQQVDQRKDFILIGVSFGGMIAVEMARHISPSCIIIISSARHTNEISSLYKLAGILKLHRIIPGFLLKSSNFISHYFFGTETTEEKKLLQSILKDTDLYFLRWALGQIVCWKTKTSTPGLIKIHGTRDRILKYRQADYTIQNGGHLMIVNKAHEISGIINSLIQG